jgi:alpha-tubulin suppressor-like RCC1 family protein
MYPAFRKPFSYSSAPIDEQIGAGQNHSMFLTREGKVYSWGAGMYTRLRGLKTKPEEFSFTPYQIHFPPETTPIEKLIVGQFHDAFISVGGDVYISGLGENGQLGNR